MINSCGGKKSKLVDIVWENKATRCFLKVVNFQKQTEVVTAAVHPQVLLMYKYAKSLTIVIS